MFFSNYNLFIYKIQFSIYKLIDLQKVQVQYTNLKLWMKV